MDDVLYHSCFQLDISLHSAIFLVYITIIHRLFYVIQINRAIDRLYDMVPSTRPIDSGMATQLVFDALERLG